MMNLRDYTNSETVTVFFTTNQADGSAVAPSTAFEAGDIILYKNGSATQRTSTAGWTIASPFDSIVGLHAISFDLTDNTDAGFYAAGASFTAVLSPDTETVDGKTIVAVIGTFSILANTAVKPSTVGRTLNIDSSSLAEVNVIKVGPSGSGTAQTAADLAGILGALNTAASSGDPGTTTTLVAYLKQLVNTLEGSAGLPTFPAAAVAGNAVSLAEVIRSIDTRLPSALVSSRMDSSVGAMAAGVLTATAIAADAITDAKVAADVTIASVTGAVGSVTGAVGSVTGNVGGNVTGSVGSVVGAVGSVTGAVGSVTGAVGSVTGNVGGNVTGSIGSLATQAKADVNAEADTALSDYGALKPTVAGRTLDVSAGGEGGVDWANVGSPTTVVGLSGTTVKTATDVATQATDIQARLPAALVGGKMDSTIGALGTDAITAASVSATGAAKIADIVMRRTTAHVEASSDGDTLGGRSLYGAVARLAHKASISAGTLTVTKSDDTTSLTTEALTSAASAAPITAKDPA